MVLGYKVRQSGHSHRESDAVAGMRRGGGLAELTINAVLGCLCPRDGSPVAAAPLYTRVILALVVALAALLLGAVAHWLLGGECDPAWTVEQPEYRPTNSMVCDTWRAYTRTFNLG